MELYLARHGRTVWNTELKMQGRMNSPLTDDGIRGCYELRKSIRDLGVKFEACYVSPLPRALQTAYIALSDDDGHVMCPFTVTDMLKEMDLGAWEGMYAEDCKTRWPETFDNFKHHPDKFTPVAGGETFHDTRRRAEQILKFLEEKNRTASCGPVILITHAIIIQSIINAVTGSPVSELRSTPFIEQAKLFKINSDYPSAKDRIIMFNGSCSS